MADDPGNNPAAGRRLPVCEKKATCVLYQMNAAGSSLGTRLAMISDLLAELLEDRKIIFDAAQIIQIEQTIRLLRRV